MTTIQAMVTIIREANKEKRSVTGYKRCCKALRVLGFNDEDAKTVLIYLDYVSPHTREPYEWLAAKLAA